MSKASKRRVAAAMKAAEKIVGVLKESGTVPADAKVEVRVCGRRHKTKEAKGRKPSHK